MSRSRAARRWRLLGAVVLLGTLVATAVAARHDDGTTAAPTTSPTPTTTTTTTTTTPTTTTTTTGRAGTALVDTLVVAEPSGGVPPYRRDAFGGDWDYDPASGCNTRERVLIAEAIVAPQVDDRCRSTGGRWRSAYDGLEVDDVAALEIDHLVPLADAWRSGAAAWTDERRDAFANDLSHPETLIAVTSRTNRSKSDSTPDRWLPPDRSSWCRYATDWVAVKAAWQLTVTPPEKAALVQVLGGC